MAPQHPSVFRRARVGSWKRGAVNAATAALAVLLLVGAGPRAVPQEQDNESQPVDQVEVTKPPAPSRRWIRTGASLSFTWMTAGPKPTASTRASRTSISSTPETACRDPPSTEEVIMMADKSNDGGATVAKYGAVAVTPEGETPPTGKVDTTRKLEESIP